MSMVRQTLIISFVVALWFTILILAIFSFWPPISFLTHLGYLDAVTLANMDNLDDPFTSHIVGELVKSGTLISVKDIWSFQTGFYQTTIGFLVAINALIAAVSVFYIKSTSEEKAEETISKYISSQGFDYILNNKIQNVAVSKLKSLQDDYSSTIDDLRLNGELLHETIERLNSLERNGKEIRLQLRIISERVAHLDMGEREGKDLILAKR